MSKVPFSSEIQWFFFKWLKTEAQWLHVQVVPDRLPSNWRNPGTVTLRIQVLNLERDHEGGYLTRASRVMGVDGVAELPTIIEVVGSTCLSLSDSEGATCHYWLCVYTPSWGAAQVLILLFHTRKSGCLSMNELVHTIQNYKCCFFFAFILLCEV